MSDWITDREPPECVPVLAWIDDELFIAVMTNNGWYNVYDGLGRWDGKQWTYNPDDKTLIDAIDWMWARILEPPEVTP